ncbi:MAG: 16S rRNA processing protein RimM [Clostridiaceae bacterium]|jgi:16S rRNA processing protein RimM|nr:16S rRNA processing protein RimM [Clostridiaceae bacterium]
MIQDLLLVGEVHGAHGVRGELAVEVFSDDKLRFRPGLTLLCRLGSSECERQVESVSFSNRGVILLLSGIASREEAQKQRGTQLFVRREDGLPLSENEYYTADLVGMQVFDQEYGELGKLADMFDTGAHYVLLVEKAGENNLLIPFTKQTIVEIDQQKEHILVKLTDGLYELYRQCDD